MEWKSQRDLLPSVNSISAVGWSLTKRSNYFVINEPPLTSANGRQMAIGDHLEVMTNIDNAAHDDGGNDDDEAGDDVVDYKMNEVYDKI